jgi:hypothetical protein
MGQSWNFKHEMQAVTAPNKEVNKDMKKKTKKRSPLSSGSPQPPVSHCQALSFVMWSMCQLSTRNNTVPVDTDTNVMSCFVSHFMHLWYPWPHSSHTLFSFAHYGFTICRIFQDCIPCMNGYSSLYIAVYTLKTYFLFGYYNSIKLGIQQISTASLNSLKVLQGYWRGNVWNWETSKKLSCDT